MVIVSVIDLKSVLKHRLTSADNIVKGGGKSTMRRIVFPPPNDATAPRGPELPHYQGFKFTLI